MRCRFKHKIFQNEENGYTIAIFTTQDTSVPLSARDKYLASRNIIGFSAIGFGLPLTDEIELEMEGRWESGEHGTQYQVENFMEVVPRTKEGILGYLSSGAIKGIGPKMADTIFRKFGLQTLEIMENNPQELLKIRGISEKKLAAIVESYGKNQVFRELMTFLAPFKVTPKKVNMILKKFGNESVDIIRHRPYMLSAVKGFGFLTVDAIGRQCCCALNDPMRISGCIGHIMNQAMKEGHLFKQRQEVIREALEMLNRDLQVMAVSEQDVSQVLYRLVLQKSIVVEEERIYSIRQYEEETQTASMIARRLLEKPVLLSIEPELEKAQKTLGITLSETQKQAVRMVFAHPISIITGGPGTGKTTVLKVILYIHQALCRSEVQLMAPTGRAARRMVESTGCENASTMHLALGLLGDDTDFEPDFEYLSAGFLNVDEVSMVDMHLAYEFFRRVSRHVVVGCGGAAACCRCCVGCGIDVGLEHAVAHGYGAVGNFCQVFVMRYNHECLSELVAQTEEQLVQFLLVFRVETARRLVGKNNGRVVYQCACHCHTLLLAARKLIGLMLCAVGQSHEVEQGFGLLLCLAARFSANQGRYHDVLERGELRQKLVKLKHEAYALISEL